MGSGIFNSPSPPNPMRGYLAKPIRILVSTGRYFQSTKGKASSKSTRLLSFVGFPLVSRGAHGLGWDGPGRYMCRPSPFITGPPHFWCPEMALQGVFKLFYGPISYGPTRSNLLAAVLIRSRLTKMGEKNWYFFALIE